MKTKDKKEKRIQLFTEISDSANNHLQYAKEKSGKSIRKLVNDAILKIKI